MRFLAPVLMVAVRWSAVCRALGFDGKLRRLVLPALYSGAATSVSMAQGKTSGRVENE